MSGFKAPPKKSLGQHFLADRSYVDRIVQAVAPQPGVRLVEIGPGKALSGFVKKTVPELPVYAVETAAELKQLTETLKGASL